LKPTRGANVRTATVKGVYIQVLRTRSIFIPIQVQSILASPVKVHLKTLKAGCSAFQ